MLLARTMREAEFQTNVMMAARQHRLLAYHTLNSPGSPEGYPDCTFVGQWVIWRELKREGEGPTAAQVGWLLRLRAAGCDADVWWPRHWYAGGTPGGRNTSRVQEELRALTQPPPAARPWDWLWTP
jgi:hypothetical protein